MGGFKVDKSLKGGQFTLHIRWLSKIKMYSLHNAVFLTVLCVVSVQSDKVCSVVEHREMQADFTNCSRRYMEEHFNSENGDTCHLVNSVLGNCGELWERCHTSREVRRMRDLHIEALVRQYGSAGGLEGCDPVQEYRQSGRTPDDPVEDVTCSDTKTMDIQTKFQTCSHSTATSVYQTIQDLTSVKIISDKLCKALTTIGTVCVKHLNECFAEDDVRQMRKSHLEEMKTFLLRISQGKVTNNAFDNCKVMEYVEDKVKITYQNSNVKNNDQPKEDFVQPDYFELDSITESDYIQEPGKYEALEQDETTLEKEPIDKKSPSIEKILDKKQVSSTETPSSKPKGARSVDFLETKSPAFNDIEVPVKGESNPKYSTVTNVPDVGKHMSNEKYDSRNNNLETSDGIDSDGASTVSKQAMVSHEEGERLQYMSAAGGGNRLDSHLMAVIASLLILVLMSRV